MREYENKFDTYRDGVADYTTDELQEELERLTSRVGILDVPQNAKKDAIIEELEDRGVEIDNDECEEVRRW